MKNKNVYQGWGETRAMKKEDDNNNYVYIYVIDYHKKNWEGKVEQED